MVWIASIVDAFKSDFGLPCITSPNGRSRACPVINIRITPNDFAVVANGSCHACTQIISFQSS